VAGRRRVCDCNVVRVGGWRLEVEGDRSRQSKLQRRRGRRGSQVVEELREDSQGCDVLQLASPQDLVKDEEARRLIASTAVRF